MEGFCCIEGLVGTSKQLCAAVDVRVVGLPQNQENQVGCQGRARSLGHGRRRLRPLLLKHIFVHPHICVSFSCRSDARATARNVPSTPYPNFNDMRRAFGTKISLGLCSYFFLCTIGHRLLRGFPRNHGCQEQIIISYSFWVGPLVSASARATSPLYGIVCRLLG